MENPVRSQTYKCAPNIALLKYWGKLEKETYNLPLNSSLSLTLDPDQVTSETTITICDEAGISFTLNGHTEPLTKAHLDAVQFFLPDLQQEGKGLKVVSHNNFPTAAGMASSASGFAAFACCMAKLTNYFEQAGSQDTADQSDYLKPKYWVGTQVSEAIFGLWVLITSKQPTNTETAEMIVQRALKAMKFVSLVRRLSGSACRSIFEGYSLFRGPELIVHDLMRNFQDKGSLDVQSFLNYYFFNFGAVKTVTSLNIDPALLSVLEPAFSQLLTEAVIEKTDTDSYMSQMLARHYDIQTSQGTSVSQLKWVLHLLCSALPLETMCRMRGESLDHLRSVTDKISVFACILSSTAKEVSSKAGMTESSQTSDFLVHRVKTLEQRVQSMIRQLTQESETGVSGIFALLSQDSNSFHSVCLDTVPPIRYISDRSFRLSLDLPGRLAERGGCGVTFDAGDNPFVFCVRGDGGDLQKERAAVEEMLREAGVEKLIWAW